MKAWRQTASWDHFWMEKQRELAELNTQKSSPDHATSVLRTEAASVTSQHMSCTISETENDDRYICGVPNSAIDTRDTTNTHSLPKKQQTTCIRLKG
ncbi:hypothetical protein BDF14DRAFT_1804010 [Spinellus fusiger]|nr:hypothetical protein BDF14DRAFT_1870250 [Spinellus fusiger]KAI7867447.1 hypothetical protein BDF14DRAFT_1804010 [Spinellus fusiger]